MNNAPDAQDVVGWLPSTVPETVIEEGPPPVTRSTSATFKFRSSQPLSSFDCRLNSAAWAACSSPKTYTGLPDGTHLFEVRAKNPIGQADQSPASRTWRVDTVPPDTTITSAPPPFSSSPTAEFAFSANEGDVTFACQLDSGAWEPCVSPRRYVELAERGHTFQVRGTDAAGNVEPGPASHAWTIDLTAPDTAITSGPSGPTPSTSATFSFTASEPGSFQCSLDGAGFTGCSSPRTYTGLAEGGHTFEVRAIDRAGNADVTPGRREWSAHGPPSLSLSGPLADAQGAQLTDDTYELWVDAGSTIGMQSIEVKVDGQRADYASEPCAADDDRCAEDQAFEFQPGNYSLGNHTVTVIARDVLGSTSQGSVSANVVAGQDTSANASATAAPRSGTGPGCTVFEFGTVEEGVAVIVHGTWAGGTETTEYFSDSEYRITRCVPDGSLAVQQEVSVVKLHDGNLVPIVASTTVPIPLADLATLEPDAQYLTRDITYRDPAGTSAVDWLVPSAAVLPPTQTSEQLPDHQTGEPGGTDNGCVSDQFVRKRRWRFHPRYKIHRDSLPHGGKSKRRLIGGHNVWNKTSDNCGLRDRTDFSMLFDGMAGQPAAVGDGRDTVDFGALKGDFGGDCAGGLACTVTSTTQLDGETIAHESDIRFNGSPPGAAGWYSGLGNPPSDRYDLKSTAAHEAGHKVGLGHVAASTDQTMCSPCGIKGVKYRRTLGKGDVFGLRRIYQGRNPASDPR